MGITVPSSSPITLAALDSGGEFFQTFTLADDTGAQYTQNNPFFTTTTVTGYSSTSANYQGSYMPTGGVYIADLTGTDFTEMADGESGTVRMNNRRAIMTASDGQVTTLTETLTNNYHDTVVASGAAFTGVTVPAYANFFVYTAQNQTRYIYIPISKSGWNRLSIYIKHTLVNTSNSLGASPGVIFYPDFGQFSNDFVALSDTISGIAGSSVGRVYSCYDTVFSGSSSIYVPEFNSPLAGVIIAITNNQDVTGNIEIYASKGS
jgi:hypothetical protein